MALHLSINLGGDAAASVTCGLFLLLMKLEHMEANLLLSSKWRDPIGTEKHLSIALTIANKTSMLSVKHESGMA